MSSVHEKQDLVRKVGELIHILPLPASSPAQATPSPAPRGAPVPMSELPPPQPGLMIGVLTEDEILSSAGEAMNNPSVGGARPSTQERKELQQAKLRRKVVDDAKTSKAILGAHKAPSLPEPEIVERWKKGQGRNLKQKMAELGIKDQEAVQFVDSIVQTVGKVRARNKKLVQVHYAVNARSEAALKNCLFKLASCKVQMQPEPTPGWSWVMGTLGDDEYHAFKRVNDKGPEQYCALTISYDPGHVGEVDRIFSLAHVTLHKAQRARYHMLGWNHRLRLLDTLINRIETLEVSAETSLPGASLASTSMSFTDSASLLEGAGEPVSDGTERLVSMSNEFRKDRDALYDKMLGSCETLAEREERGEDHTDQNIEVAACMQRLPEFISEVNNILRAGLLAEKNGQGIRCELGDGRYARLGVPHEGWENAKTGPVLIG